MFIGWQSTKIAFTSPFVMQDKIHVLTTLAIVFDENGIYNIFSRLLLISASNEKFKNNLFNRKCTSARGEFLL